MQNAFAVVPLAALGAGVVLELILGRWLNRQAKGWLALAAGLIALIATGALLPSILRQGSLEASFFASSPTIPLTYRIDGLSLVFALMATGIGSAILLYSQGYMAHEPASLTRFYALMLTFIAGLVNLVFSHSLLLAYLSWEVIGLCSYFLVGYWYTQQPAADGARKVLVITHLAGYGFLAGILLLFQQAGSFAWNDPSVSAAFSTGIFLLLLVAAMAKSVIFPLHTWIPEAMNAPTPVSALLHSACYVKAGVYLVARLYSIRPMDSWPAGWNILIVALGCVTMLVGALFALAQTDLKRLLAFSTISQLGHIITALGLGTSLGLAAGLFYTVSHGLFKGTLFLCAGSVQHATGTRDMRRLGGLATQMPATATIWLVAAAAIIGVPMGNGFVAKWLLFSAALDAGSLIVVLVAWFASVLTAFYMLKATTAVFYGEMPADRSVHPPREAPLSMRIGMGVLAGLCLLFGVAPQILMRGLIEPAASGLIGMATQVSVSWFGMQTRLAGAQMKGDASMTIGAIVTLAALTGGLVWYRLSRPRPAASAGLFTGGDPLPAHAMPDASDFTSVAEHAFAPLYRVLNPDPLYMAVWGGIRRLGETLGRLSLSGERRSILVTSLAGALALALALIF